MIYDLRVASWKLTIRVKLKNTNSKLKVRAWHWNHELEIKNTSSELIVGVRK